MSESMAETVARAIYDELEGPVNNADYRRQLAQWDLAQNLARAVIEAMREPTEAMLEAGARGSGEDSEAVASGVWEAMIDAALKP